MSPVPQPPFPAELLADLHAGNIDPELEARLWPVVRDDPEARRYLDSLDEVSRSLAGLAGSGDIVRPMPRDIAARLENLAEHLGREAAQQGPPAPAPGDDTEDVRPVGISAAEAPENGTAAVPGPAGNLGAAATPGPETTTPAPIPLDRRRRRRQIAATFAAAALVAVAAAAALVGLRSGEGGAPPTAAPPSGENIGPSGELDTVVAMRALGRNDVGGRLADPTALAACVRAAGIDRPILGSTEMRFGRHDDAVLILVGGRDGAQITALVVGSGCGPGNPEVLATTDIG